MVKPAPNKEKRNRMRAKEVFSLLDKYEIDAIENSLIYLFLKNLGRLNVKNKLIKKRLENLNKEAINFVYNFVTKNNLELTLKNIERIFELLLEPKDRKLSGAFYTPEFIVNYINDRAIEKNNPNFKVCDCSCGSGAFLVLASEKISKENKKSIINTIENNIYGVDIIQRSVDRAKIILSLLAIQNNEDAKEIKFNIRQGDSLNSSKFDWRKEFPEIFSKGGFDGVIGNPPYIRIQDFNKDLKDILIKGYKAINKGNFNLYFAFFELAIRLLKKDGKLGYITPNNYFTSLAGRELREYLQNNKLLRRIINFNHLRVFEDATTYTCVTLIDKKEKDFFEYATISNKEKLLKLNELKFSKINFSDLNSKKWRLMNETDFYNVKKIENVGSPLGKFAEIKVGIATLKDILYFIDGEKKERDYYVKEHNDKGYLIEKDITRKIVKIATVNNEEDVKNNKRRIIFPYVKSGGGYRLMNEDELKSKFPRCCEYLKDIREELKKRDKGKEKLKIWYGYGREQGLNLYGEKLLTKTFSNRPNFMLDSDKFSLFCNGYAVFPRKEEDIEILKRILNSKIMDYYARKTSVEIEGDYQCYQKNFIELFSIPELSGSEKEFLKKETDKRKIDSFLIKKYGLKLVPGLTC